MRYRALWCVLIWITSLTVGAADAPPDLPVVLPDGRTIMINPAVRASLPEIRIQATSHGKTRDYVGIDFRLALKAAGLEPTDSIRGVNLSRVVVAEAADGYRALFSLAELDPTLGNHLVLLTAEPDQREQGDGPIVWRLVVPADGRQTRWVWRLNRVVVRDVGK